MLKVDMSEFSGASSSGGNGVIPWARGLYQRAEGSAEHRMSSTPDPSLRLKKTAALGMTPRKNKLKSRQY
jgi:hypothetical protein